MHLRDVAEYLDVTVQVLRKIANGDGISDGLQRRLSNFFLRFERGEVKKVNFGGEVGYRLTTSIVAQPEGEKRVRFVDMYKGDLRIVRD